MSGGSSVDQHRPVMLVATDLLRSPPTRIAKLGPVVFPRSITIKTAAGVVGGGIAGMFPAFVVLGLSLSAVIWGVMLGGAAGAVLVNWSPLRGESFARWVGLNVSVLRSDTVEVGGHRTRLFVGTARVRRAAAGRVRVMRGAVSVPAGSVDSRGVPIPMVSPVFDSSSVPAGSGLSAQQPSAADSRRAMGQRPLPQ